MIERGGPPINQADRQRRREFVRQLGTAVERLGIVVRAEVGYYADHDSPYDEISSAINGLSFKVSELERSAAATATNLGESVLYLEGRESAK